MKRALWLLLGALLLGGCASMATQPSSTEPAPTVMPVITQPVIEPTPVPTQMSIEDELAQIDQALQRSIPGNIAYNAPDTMGLNQTVEVQLLLSPSLSPTQLAGQITEPGQVVAAQVSITPWMRAELISVDPDAFTIQPLHADAQHLTSTIEPSEWRWSVTARKGGSQQLVLTVYRLVEYQNQQDWRKVEEYRSSIDVNVTFLQRLAAFDWYWLVGLVLAGVGFPLLVSWIDRKRRSGGG